ncbi:MAG TPA: hypothetical protein VGM19_07835 [Armatimonadota bacterium]|jgi:hypothetical protein
MPKTRIALLVAALWGVTLVGSALATAQAANPTVLFTGDLAGCQFEVATRLNQDGFALNKTGWGSIEDVALTEDNAKKYNAIVVAGLGRANADMTLSSVTQTTIDTLTKYLQAGGGVVMFPMFGQMATAKPPQDAFLQPLGLTPLFQEQAYDPGAIVATSWNLPFGLTTDITASPITAGVKALAYPVPLNRVGAQNHNIPFTADQNWKIVVRGTPASYTKSGALQQDQPPNPGTYTASVPLVAYRQVGKGRIVYIGITPEYFIGAYATTTLESTVLDKGVGGTPSDGFKLLEDSLKWVSQPSADSGTMGGATMDASLLENPYKTKFGEPMKWAAKLDFPAVEPAWPGVIGARSTYSSGTASVDQWVAEAKRQKLSFLVFLEDFSRLSPQRFDQLKADCKRLTDKNFAAIPGFTIDDEVGNHYFYFGTTFPYPDQKFLDHTGKFFVARDPEVNQTDPYVKGQLSMTVLDYAYSISSFKLTAGNYNFSHSAAPFANWFSNWDAVGVVTLDNGKLTDDFMAGYRALAGFGNGPTPLALNFMDSPAQLATSKWKTILRMPENGGYTVGGKLGPDTKLVDYFNNWNFYPDSPNKIYVSSGPSIESWAFIGPRDYGGDNRGDFVWQNNRWALHGRVTSPLGLREIVVYDGVRPFRRYLPNGAPEYDLYLDLEHDRQHNLTLVATDMRGGTAVSGEQWDRNHRSEEFMCADRNNQLSYGYLTRSDGTGILIGGNQTLATPNKRLTPNVSPPGTFKNDPLLGAPAFDGATGGEPDIIENVIAILPDGKQVVSPQVTESRRVMCNGDVNIGEGLRAWDFTDKVGVYNVWHTLWRTAPRDDFTVSRRNTFFNIDPDSPLPVFLWSTDITLLRDMPNQGFMTTFLRSQKEKNWAYRTSDGKFEKGAWATTGDMAYQSLPFGLNSYIALSDSPLGSEAVFPLTPGLVMNMALPQRNNPMLVLTPGASPQKKGETARVEILALGIPRVTAYSQMFADAGATVEKFYRDFGLDGGKTGYVVTAQAGTVVGQRYIMDVDNAGTGCFSGQLTGSLISSLPIRVNGLNDNWSCYLYDRTLQQARPLGVVEGQTYAMVRLHDKLDVFVGAPLTADNAQVHIQLTQVGEKAWKAEIHNPTDAEVRVTVKKSAFFDPLKASAFTQETISLPAGSSVWRDL